MKPVFQDFNGCGPLAGQVAGLYASAFPSDERREPGEFLKMLRARPNFLCRAGVSPDDGRMLCFISYWDFGSFHYIEHFAVMPHLRGQGIGTAAMRDFIGNVSPTILLEVEPPAVTAGGVAASACCDARRRVAFYQSLGFTLWSGFSYVQPPYSPDKSPVPMTLMTRGGLDSRHLPAAAAIVAAQVYGRQPEN